MATNAAARLPSHLAMMWLSIESVGERLSVLAQVAKASGEPLTGRSRDFKSWFRILRIAESDLWKCCPFFNGHFYRDERMQMGRVASAHTGQRTFQLIVAIMNEDAAAQTDLLMARSALHPAKARWIRARTDQLGKYQAATALMQVFQDDLLKVAVGKDMEDVIERVETDTLRHEPSVRLSPKPEANRPFSTKFEFIRAEFDTSDLGELRRRPANHILDRLREQVPQFLERGPALMKISTAQELIGWVAFCARFLTHGRTRLNSAYACLAAAEQMPLRSRQVMISQEMLEDLRAMWTDITGGCWSPLTVSPTLHTPGLQGASSDASGSVEKVWGHTHLARTRTASVRRVRDS